MRSVELAEAVFLIFIRIALFLLALAFALSALGLLGMSIFDWAKQGDWRHPSVYNIVQTFYGLEALQNWVGVRDALHSVPYWFAGVLLGVVCLMGVSLTE